MQIKEYEPEIMLSDGITVKQPQLAAHNRRQREALEQQRRAEREREARRPHYWRPFRASNANGRCTAEQCALFADGDCPLRLVTEATAETVPTRGHTAKCPIAGAGTCTSACVLHNGAGCGIGAIARTMIKKE